MCLTRIGDVSVRGKRIDELEKQTQVEREREGERDI